MTPFGIYFHWPFCEAKCPYCDFNSHVAKTNIDQKQFARAFAQEMAFIRERTGPRLVTSVFFGGGTPSLMAPETVAFLLEAVARYWRLLPEAEITLEANPSTVEEGRFIGYKEAGVNRLSLGVQAFHDEALKRLGRIHTACAARSALALGAKIFDRFSFDLIYARPQQTIKMWEDELKEALFWAKEHLSLYQLTIEKGTRYAHLYQAGKLSVPTPQEAARFYEKTEEILQAHGFSSYEVSNYARPGGESQHNLLYWRYQEYAGFGPGAHGRFLERERAGLRTVTITERKPTAWLQAVAQKGHGIIEEEYLSRAQQADEMLLMGMRLQEGVDRRAYEALRGQTLPEECLLLLQEQGLIEHHPTSLRATPKGRMVLDHVICTLAL